MWEETSNESDLDGDSTSKQEEEIKEADGASEELESDDQIYEGMGTERRLV